MTNKGLIEEVKNWKQTTVNNPNNFGKLREQIDKMSAAKGKIVDGVEIKDARLVFRQDVTIPNEISDYASSKGISIKKFRGVD